MGSRSVRAVIALTVVSVICGMSRDGHAERPFGASLLALDRALSPNAWLVSAAMPGRSDSTNHSAGGAFSAPTPRQLERLQRVHSPRTWLVVTTRSERYEVRVDHFGVGGLLGLHSRKGPLQSPGLPWQDVAMIERSDSRFALGTFLGIAAGATMGGLIGANLVGGEKTGQSVMIGMGVGATLGGLFGRGVGYRAVRLTPLYRAEGFEIPMAEEPLTGSARQSAEATTPQPAQPTRSDARIEAVQRLATRGTVVRIDGTFGSITGRVGSADSAGLHGLRPDPKRDSGLEPRLEMIPWSSITAVRRLGNQSHRGALIGAILLAIPAGVVGGALGSLGDSGGGAAAAGLAAGGIVGAGAGFLIGAVIPGWHLVRDD